MTKRPHLRSPSAVVLLGYRTMEELRDLLRGGNRVLVIEPDRDRARRLKEELGNSQARGLVVISELLGHSLGVASWYTYNDIRLNGTSSPQELQQHYPNLKLLGQEERPLRPLGDLLHRWQDEDTSVAELFKARRGWWRLDGPMALAAVQSAGPWLESCDHLELSPSAQSAVADNPDAQAALRSACLASVPKDGLTGEAAGDWRHDQMIEKEKQVSVAEKQLNALRSHHEQIITQRDLLLQQRDQLAADNDQLTLQTNHLAEQCDQLTAERDTLLLERDKLAAERDALLKERNEVENERDNFKNLNDELNSRQRDLELLGKQTEQQLAYIKDLFVRVSTARMPD
jgi:hypothetical protein